MELAQVALHGIHTSFMALATWGPNIDWEQSCRYGVPMPIAVPFKNTMNPFGRMGWLDVFLSLVGVLLSLLLIPSGWNWN
jgi:hypothetical protein